MKTEQRPEDVTLEEQVEAFKAWKRGKEAVQYWDRNSQSWIGLYQVSYIDSNTVIRRKPQPKLRPWKPEEVPVGALCMRKDGEFTGIITGYDQVRVWLFSSHNYEAMLEEFEVSLEPVGTPYTNRTWLPCGVEE